jgi:hypothetical protein
MNKVSDIVLSLGGHCDLWVALVLIPKLPRQRADSQRAGMPRSQGVRKNVATPMPIGSVRFATRVSVKQATAGVLRSDRELLTDETDHFKNARKRASCIVISDML